MITVNALSEVAALMGDPARAAMLQLLMDGRAHTASELALTAGVTAQTASGHLGRMVEANLLAARAQGRNRFYRLASGEVAHAIESLMALAGTRAPPASMHAAWRYEGSLTTPPCTEGVHWFVLESPITLSGEQLERLRGILHVNNRPVQALHERTVSEDPLP